jgi:hypothetical protein
MTTADRIMRFYKQLQIDARLPKGIEVMNPFLNEDTLDVCNAFYSKFYKDNTKRRIIFGINPGRFGAGITGIPFTDPVRLESECGIQNDFDKKPELSSEFVYLLINSMGGPAHFYKHYFIGAISPLGFVKDGKNYNYYDDLELQKKLKPFIVKTMVQQVALGMDKKKCFCMGQGKNFDYLTMLNSSLKIFDEIIPLPHPRWIMQYRRKKLDTYLHDISRQLSH